MYTHSKQKHNLRESHLVADYGLRITTLTTLTTLGTFWGTFWNILARHGIPRDPHGVPLAFPLVPVGPMAPHVASIGRHGSPWDP